MKNRKNRRIGIGAALAAYFGAMVAAFGSGGQTHGGGAIVCRSPTGKIIRAEILDLFEARELRNVSFIRVPDLVKTRIAVLDELRRRYVGKSLYPPFLTETMEALRPRFRILASNIRLELIPDAYPTITEKGCAIEQLAAFVDQGDHGEEILVDREILRALSPLDRLALELHESAYYLDRHWRQSLDSVFARKIVGYLLADRPDPRLDELLQEYAFGLPMAGRYFSQHAMNCRVELQLREDGGIRVFTSGAGTCDAAVSPRPFSGTGYADFFPSGERNEWVWSDREADQKTEYPAVFLRLLYPREIQLGTALFRGPIDKGSLRELRPLRTGTLAPRPFRTVPRRRPTGSAPAISNRSRRR